MKMRILIVLPYIFCLFITSPLLSQRDSSVYDFGDFGGIILLDSIVVSASRSSLNIQDFVDMVRNDESFYTAFNNIRTLSYSANNQIKMYDKKDKIRAEYSSLTKQYFDGKCRTMKTEKEQVSGDYFKKKRKLRYYTAKMYERIFFTNGKVCSTDPEFEDIEESKGMGKHIAELKKLIFSPGEKADIPLIGKKTEIFSEEMAQYYNFSISSKKFKDSIECYVFGVVIKPEFQFKKEDKTVIKNLETYFEKSNFQVIARNYTLTYAAVLFDFDVNMEIELKKVKDYYVPDFIKYEGWWDVPTKKPEISFFSARFFDFH